MHVQAIEGVTGLVGFLSYSLEESPKMNAYQCDFVRLG